MPQLMGRIWKFSCTLLKQMLSYSWPLLILAIAGMLSQNMGQLLIPYLISDEEAARSMIGIYGANMIIAIVMVMFTQAFRYAYEPSFSLRQKSRRKQRNDVCRRNEIFHYFRMADFPRGDVLSSICKILHISGILGRFKGGARYDGSRIMLRCLL